jgi:hypothetical protein
MVSAQRCQSKDFGIAASLGVRLIFPMFQTNPIAVLGTLPYISETNPALPAPAPYPIATNPYPFPNSPDTHVPYSAVIGRANGSGH